MRESTCQFQVPFIFIGIETFSDDLGKINVDHLQFLALVRSDLRLTVFQILKTGFASVNKNAILGKKII